MGNRIAFNVSDEAFEKLIEKCGDGVMPHEVVKETLYDLLGVKLERSSEELSRMARVAERKQKLEEELARLSGPRDPELSLVAKQVNLGFDNHDEDDDFGGDVEVALPGIVG